MKLKEFKSFIREEIIGVLSETTMVGPQTTSDDIPVIAKSEKTSPETVKAAIAQAKKSNTSVSVAEEANNLTSLQQKVYDFESEVSPNPDEFIEDIKKLSSVKDVYNYYAHERGWLQDKDFRYLLKDLMMSLSNNENDLNEMARAKVSYALNTDKAQDLKDVIEKAKGNVKKALEYLLNKETMSVADVAKELGLKDTASINNPKFRELMNALKEKGIVSLVGAPAGEKPAKEKPAKQASMAAVEKDIETGEEEADDYYKAGDEDSAPEESDIDKQAAKAASKLTKRTSKLDKVLKGLIQVEKEMKELAGQYKNAEGEEKASIVAKLKEKTAQKKELEALKDKYEFDVV